MAEGQIKEKDKSEFEESINSNTSAASLIEKFEQSASKQGIAHFVYDEKGNLTGAAIERP